MIKYLFKEYWFNKLIIFFFLRLGVSVDGTINEKGMRWLTLNGEIRCLRLNGGRGW
jgi:hypothetical protein